MKSFTCTSLRVGPDGISILDQTLLPQREVWLPSPTPQTMLQFIRDLKVRGAPLIGVAAALQVAQLAEQLTEQGARPLAGPGGSEGEIESAICMLREARPTAVNLMNALDRMLAALRTGGPRAIVVEAERQCAEDIDLCERMANHGASLLQSGENILTHCNTGGLATVGLGTALGAIIKATQMGRKLHVYVDETRPLLQGGRLTTWELERAQIPFTLICDSMAGALMQRGKVDRVLVGADRIARNGDFANKVGTYGLAVNCKFHSVPFYVVAPQTTIDLNCKHGADIPVEERAPSEVRGVRGAFGSVEWATPGAPVWNPAFDVTPEALVSAWVTDRGVFSRRDVKAGALSSTAVS